MSEEQKKTIFRQQSLDRLGSPEQLTDYLHVTNIGVWVFISMIILLLAGFFAWASLGKLETTVTGKAAVTDGTARITVIDRAQVTPGMTVRIGDKEVQVSEVREDDMGFTLAFAPMELADGNYNAVIVIESVSPISFLLRA